MRGLSEARCALQDEVVEPVNARMVKSVDEIPAVCLEEDLIAIFRLSGRECGCGGSGSQEPFWRLLDGLRCRCFESR